MDHSNKMSQGKQDHGTVITRYINQAEGLEIMDAHEKEFSIFQQADGKKIRFSVDEVEEVLVREDSEGREFLQVNFIDGRKILLTERLIGFKPIHSQGLDLSKLPKVVTTPDLVSVVEAIEESMNCGLSRPEEVDVLKRVFDSVLLGAQSVGFELEDEKAWLKCISTNHRKASA